MLYRPEICISDREVLQHFGKYFIFVCFDALADKKTPFQYIRDEAKKEQQLNVDWEAFLRKVAQAEENLSERLAACGLALQHAQHIFLDSTKHWDNPYIKDWQARRVLVHTAKEPSLSGVHLSSTERNIEAIYELLDIRAEGIPNSEKITEILQYLEQLPTGYLTLKSELERIILPLNDRTTAVAHQYLLSQLMLLLIAEKSYAVRDGTLQLKKVTDIEVINQNFNRTVRYLFEQIDELAISDAIKSELSQMIFANLSLELAHNAELYLEAHRNIPVRFSSKTNQLKKSSPSQLDNINNILAIESYRTILTALANAFFTSEEIHTGTHPADEYTQKRSAKVMIALIQELFANYSQYITHEEKRAFVEFVNEVSSYFRK